MFNELLRAGLVLAFVFLLVWTGGILWMRAVLEGLLRFIVQVRRRDESDGMFKITRWTLSDEEVYESGYGTE